MPKLVGDTQEEAEAKLDALDLYYAGGHEELRYGGERRGHGTG